MKGKAEVLAYLQARHPRMYTVRRIAESVRLPRSTVQKALTSLRNEKQVDRDIGCGDGYLWHA
jgi:DNA-binding IclR family transcriptional regulator